MGRRLSASYRSDEPVKRAGELAEAARLAAPEVAHGVAVLAVPFRPQRREAADLVAALADVPGLGDQLDLADDRVLVDQVEERREPVDLVELAGQRGGQVEPEAVDVHLVTQYRSESMISRSDSWWRTLRLLPVPVVS